MAGKIPLVDYLVLDDGDPHLIAQECADCGARFFDRRNACAACFATEFTTVPVATEGTVRRSRSSPSPHRASRPRLWRPWSTAAAPRCAPT